jgi:hypothetical protein
MELEYEMNSESDDTSSDDNLSDDFSFSDASSEYTEDTYDVWECDDEGRMCIKVLSPNGQIHFYPVDENGHILLFFRDRYYTAVRHDDDYDKLYNSEGVLTCYFHWSSLTFFY